MGVGKCSSRSTVITSVEATDTTTLSYKIIFLKHTDSTFILHVVFLNNTFRNHQSKRLRFCYEKTTESHSVNLTYLLSAQTSLKHLMETISTPAPEQNNIWT